MFILDDLALSPVKGFMWLIRELHGAVEREYADERERVMRELQSLHMRLEAGQITEDEFDELEVALLDRLDELDGMAPEGNEGEAQDEDEDEEEADDEEPIASDGSSDTLPTESESAR